MPLIGITSCRKLEDYRQAVLHVGGDVRILDVSMPGMDGLAVCRKLRAHSQTRSTPIILLTSLSAPEDESRGLEAGADDYLTKPINPSRLVARVESHLRRLRTRPG